MKVSKQPVTIICLENNLSDTEAASKFAEFFESACSPNNQLYCDQQRVKYKAEIANCSGDYLRPDLFDAGMSHSQLQNWIMANLLGLMV